MSANGIAARDRVLELLASGDYETEVVPCLCGSRTEELICTVDRYYIPHRTVLCSDCGLVRTNPRWTQETYSDFYTHYYRPLYERPGQTAQAMFGVQAGNAARRAALVTASALGNESLRVLEIGCGGGWNLLPFQRRGDVVVGFDFDENYLEAGRAVGLDLRNGGLEAALIGGERYDLVMLSHVVEHLLDPIRDLMKARQLLTENGLMFIEVPNLFAVRSNLLRYWQSAHTYSFVPATLRQLMLRAGYAEVFSDSAIASIWRVTPLGPAPVKVDPKLAAKTKRFLKSREHDSRLKSLLRKVRASLP